MEELERQVGAAQTKASRWASVGVVPQYGENADTPVESRTKWSKIYGLFGAKGESQQDEVFAAVNAYFLRNGASPSGKYEKPIRTAGGVEVQAGEVVKVVGRQPGDIRQFLRGRLEDSYLFLKHNRAFKEDEALATVAENAGVSRDYAWLLADWLGRDCAYFVGHESDVYNALRTSKIANAADKRATSAPEVDKVRENAPEAKVARDRGAGFNNDMWA